jgi:UDP-3-O-[3-hydroxymyristoyl] glucosamine N-acyltransferase
MTLTAKELADTIGARVEGDGSLELTAVAAPERAGAKHMIYVEAAKHVDRAMASAAACVIAAEGIALPGKTVLRSAQPKVAFAKAAAVLLERPPIASGVHPTAIVAPLARIGADVRVGAYAVIGEDTHVGDGTQIGAHSVIGAGCWIGENCRIHPRVTLYAGARVGHRAEIHSGAVIGADGFGYAFDGERYWKFPQAGIVEIGDDVEIGANATIDRGSLDDTRIGEGVKLDNLVHVGHNVQIGAHTIVAAQTGISGSSRLGHHVVCGGQVGIADHCTLEDRSIAGAQAGIPTGKTIRSGQTVWGTPARPLDKFKEAYVWFARLPELGRRIRKLEEER